jgi:hypothetical protein
VAIGAAVIGGFLLLYRITRVRRVTITREPVFIARSLRPLSAPLSAAAACVVRLEKGVYLGKLGSSRLRNASASPVLRSEDEARWAASEMRRALR